MKEDEIKEYLVQIVAEHYLDSDDFNGYNLNTFLKVLNLSPDKFWELISELIEEGKLSLRYGEFHMNPYIRYYADIEKEKDLELLNKSNLACVVAYPTTNVIEQFVDRKRYEGRPFSLRLALGEAQLDYHCFNLSVLEFYRNDPRYYYKVDDVSGSIGIDDAYYKSKSVPESDQVDLQTFGFAYDGDMNRYVAVYTRYLHDLSPEHQQIWEAKRIDKKHDIHPDYIKSSLKGEFPDHIPILLAFTMELGHINKMCDLMNKPHLFIDTFKEDAKPRGFTFLIRPTAKEYNDFVMLLDQVMSDNINKEFFRGEISLEKEMRRKDGKVEVIQKATISLLKEWLNAKINYLDVNPVDEIIAAFRRVRKSRQRPAHKPVDDKFDQKYFNKQRNLIIDAYKAIKFIRLTLKNHPACRNYEVEDFLHNGRIRTF